MFGNSCTDAQGQILPWLSWLTAIPVATMLLLSSYGHLDNGFHFLSIVYSYKLVSPWIGVVIAATVPALQLILGLALLFVPAMRRTAFGWCILLFAGFVGVQSIALSRGLDISCGCFGSSRGPIGPVSISIAATGLLLSLVGYVACRRLDTRFSPRIPQPRGDRTYDEPVTS